MADQRDAVPAWPPFEPERPWQPVGPVAAGPPGGPAPIEPPGDPARDYARRLPLPAKTRSRASLVIELVAMALVAFALPALSLVIGLLSGGAAASRDTATSLGVTAVGLAFSLVVSWMPLLVLVLVLRGGGEPLAGFGLPRPRALDLAFGIPLWLASHVLVIALSLLFQRLGSNDVQFLQPGLPTWFLLTQSVVTAATAGVTEEVLVRGYGQTRLEQLRVPAAVVVVLPTALWAVLHLYQGVGPALTVFGLGLAYALWFQRTRRLWPLIIAHTLFDLTALLLSLTLR